MFHSLVKSWTVHFISSKFHVNNSISRIPWLPLRMHTGGINRHCNLWILPICSHFFVSNKHVRASIWLKEGAGATYGSKELAGVMATPLSTRSTRSELVEFAASEVASGATGAAATSPAMGAATARRRDHGTLNALHERVSRVANKKLEIWNFNFKSPRARNIEILRYYRQILQGSFSAVSKPIFASKY